MNKLWKVLLPFVLVIALLAVSLPAFAAVKSVSAKPIGKVRVKKGQTTNGGVWIPSVQVYDIDGDRIPSEYYKVKVTGLSKNGGKYKVTVTAKPPYTGTKTVYVAANKPHNPFTIKVGKTNFTYNKKKNQTTSIRVSGVKGNAKLGNWYSNSRYVYVKGGKVIVKKGFSGTATLSITTYPTEGYKATKKSVTIKVKK